MIFRKRKFIDFGVAIRPLPRVPNTYEDGFKLGVNQQNQETIFTSIRIHIEGPTMHVPLESFNVNEVIIL